MGFLLESLNEMWFTNEESSAGIFGHLRTIGDRHLVIDS